MMKQYEQHFRAHRDKAYRLALRIVNDTALAEDVIQEVHIKCWNNRKSLEDIGNPGAWIMRVTRNLSIDKIRSRRQTSDLDEVAYSAPAHEVQPDRAAEIENMMSILKAIVNTLPEKQKSIFQLREMEGMKYKEISEVLEVTVDEVKVNLFRARQRIKEKILNTDRYGLSSTHTETA
jgi:RNA polymerase sigma factor (sigma-70 family)